MIRLKEETKHYHSILESLPYFKTLIEHKLPLESYVNQLRSLAVVHSVLENELASSKDERVSAVWDNGLRKLPWLEDDNAFFTPRVISQDPASVQSALKMAEKIRLRSIEAPFTLLGYLYVLEGSTLGNAMHSPDIAATYQLKGVNGRHYYSNYGKDVKKHWNRFSREMNNALGDPALYESVLSAAKEAYDGLKALYTTLYPLEITGNKHHVTRINPEAGDHPIPDDPREIGAALKASDRTWAEFAYYEKRYGSRGKRFSDSDSCWLVTLTNLDPESMQEQIDWICRLLATRGMPSIMMESCLRNLYEELHVVVPEKEEIYTKLRNAADTLKKRRQDYLDAQELNSLTADFERAVKLEMAEAWKNSALLLVSAVVDEEYGVKGAVDALTDWLTQEDRFSQKWIRAVEETVTKVRKGR